MRFLVWRGTDEWRAEATTVELGDGRLRATGTQLGNHPEPYRADYRLETSAGFITRELEISSAGHGWERHLLLRHDGEGNWEADGTELPDLSRARDIDIQVSPLTNTMPVLRHHFLEAGSGEFLMAFVTVPGLEVQASEQSYEHIRPNVVRYSSGDFTAELEFDPDGFVERYEHLARRA